MTVPERAGLPTVVAPADVAARAASPHGEDVSILGAVNVILRHRSMIGWTAFVAMVATVGLGLVGPRSYVASASFVPQARKAPSSFSGLAAQLGVNIGPNEPGQNPQFYVDLLQSREILRQVVETRYTFETDTGRVSATLVELYGGDETNPALRREVASKRVDDQTAATVSARTGVVRMTATARHPELARHIAARMLQLLSEFNLGTRQSQAAAERRFAGQRLVEVAADLRAAENRFQNFLQGNREFSQAPTLQLQENRLQREISRQQQLYNTLSEAHEQAKIEEVRDTPVITVVEPPVVPARPKPRGLLLKGLLAFLGGAMVATLIAFVREYLWRASAERTTEFAQFADLRRATLLGFRRPWRAFSRHRERASGQGAS